MHSARVWAFICLVSTFSCVRESERECGCGGVCNCVCEFNCGVCNTVTLIFHTILYASIDYLEVQGQKIVEEWQVLFTVVHPQHGPHILHWSWDGVCVCLSVCGCDFVSLCFGMYVSKCITAVYMCGCVRACVCGLRTDLSLQQTRVCPSNWTVATKFPWKKKIIGTEIRNISLSRTYNCLHVHVHGMLT